MTSYHLESMATAEQAPTIGEDFTFLGAWVRLRVLRPAVFVHSLTAWRGAAVLPLRKQDRGALRCLLCRLATRGAALSQHSHSQLVLREKGLKFTYKEVSLKDPKTGQWLYLQQKPEWFTRQVSMQQQLFVLC